MATASLPLSGRPSEPTDAAGAKGLRAGTLGLASSIVIGVASTAPAYSLAATLGFIVVLVGVQSPIIVLLAFVPIVLVAFGYKELNAVDPDCGTTFTWGTRAFGPITGWLGGWAIVGADILVMASLAQVAGQYGFDLFGATGIGGNASSGWVLLVGLLWMAVMTYICYRGIELSARIQTALLTLEVTMLAVFAAVAFIRLAIGNAPAGHITPAWSWFNPAHVGSFSTFINAILLMVFIYWGWDSAVSVNEETKDSRVTPGRAAVISTVILLGIYAVVTIASQAYVGVGEKGSGLANPDNQNDVLSVLGTAVFGSAWTGTVFTKLLLLMVLSSAAASTQTTILPTARTTLSMAVYKALPKAFAKMHPRYFTPTTSTLAMGGVSALFYLATNFASHGFVIADAVTACGIMIGLYYGLTGIACAWFFRRSLLESQRSFWFRGVLPAVGGLMLLFAMGWSVVQDWNAGNDTAASYTSWALPFPPHSQVGGVWLLGIGTMVVGLLWLVWLRFSQPAFFRGETLNADTETLVPDVPVLPVSPDEVAAGRSAAVSEPG